MVIPWLRAARPVRAAFACVLALTCAASTPRPAHALDAGDLAALSLEQLGNIEVVSVLRRAERLSDTPAAVYVITAEDIHRSGVTSLPEALRLAPNLEVARADAVQYAITARGFDSVLANKLLVMVDGRTVYSPLFSGVFWESQEIRLADIERIEVVSGPGGTPWGTNAVNGVINIITRSAHDAQGWSASAGTGERDRVASAGFGGKLSSTGAFRASVRASGREHSTRANGTDIRDEATGTLGGFRTDWSGGAQEFMVEGGANRVDVEQVPGTRRVEGQYVLARWTRDDIHGGGARVQAYWDRATRDQPGAVNDELNTVDVEAQFGFRPGAGQDLLFGGGWRYQQDDLENLSPGFALLPADRDLRYANGFVEDVMTLAKPLSLTVGVKFEHNDWTGTEVLPSARLAWKVTPPRLLWAAVSRAVRAPARVDREYFVPAAEPHFLLNGGPDFVSELADVYELGIREQVSTGASYSVNGFYAEYDKLRSLEPVAGGPVFANGLRASVVGVEAWARWRVTDGWRLSAGMVQMKQNRWRAPGSNDLLGTASLGNDPTQWFTLRSSFNLPARTELDLGVREVGPLPSPHVPGYVTLDGRLGWRARPWLELSVAGQNLVGPSHAEWGADPNRAVFPRAVYARIEIHS